VPSHDEPPLHAGGAGVGTEQAAGQTLGMTVQSPAFTASPHAATWSVLNALGSAGE
jgi:hypothetical protein